MTGDQARAAYLAAPPSVIKVLLHMHRLGGITPSWSASYTNVRLRALGLIGPDHRLTATGKQVAAIATAVEFQMARRPPGAVGRALAVRRVVADMIAVSEARP